MISKATQYLHLHPGICRFNSFYIVTYKPKIRYLSLTLTEVKPVLSYMTCMSLCSLFKKNIYWHSNILYTAIYCFKFQASGVVTPYT